MKSRYNKDSAHFFTLSLAGEASYDRDRQLSAVSRGVVGKAGQEYRIRSAASVNRPTCDEMLWVNFRNGDKEAFASLYFRYFKSLIPSCFTISRDKELIKDCIHDLFIEIWKNKAKLSVPLSVKAYLVRSVQRKIIRQLKKARFCFGKYEADHYDMGIVQSIERKIIAEQLHQEQKNDVIKALEKLTRRQKEAVYLKFYANLSYAEIAGKMAISADSIYNLISKAMYNMQHELSRSPLHTF